MLNTVLEFGFVLAGSIAGTVLIFAYVNFCCVRANIAARLAEIREE